MNWAAAYWVALRMQLVSSTKANIS